MLDSLHKNHYVFLIGDFNVDLSPAIETTAAVGELDLHKVPTKITLELKLAKVVPIFKSSNSSKITNYRPISVLSFFSEVFERVMYNHITDFIDYKSIRKVIHFYLTIIDLLHC